MKSIRRGLWDGEVGKDARGRFSCRICRESLTPSTVPVGDAVDGGESPNGEGEVRSCPECGRSWRTTAPRWRTTGG